MGQRIGIFGGSFNPIHIGHLVIAEAAWQEFGLEKVIFVPTGDTPHKDMHHIPKEMRYRMVELAVENNPHFAISDIEVRRTGISYTVDTIREFQKSFPGETEFYLLPERTLSLRFLPGNITGIFWNFVISSVPEDQGMKEISRKPSAISGTWDTRKFIVS